MFAVYKERLTSLVGDFLPTSARSSIVSGLLRLVLEV